MKLQGVKIEIGEFKNSKMNIKDYSVIDPQSIDVASLPFQQKRYIDVSMEAQDYHHHS